MPALNTPILSGEQIERLAIYRNAGAFAPKGKTVPPRVWDKAAHKANNAYEAYTSWRDACEKLTDAGRTLSVGSANKLAQLRAEWIASNDHVDRIDALVSYD